MNRIYKILIIIIELVLSYLILFSNIKIVCLFKKYLHFYCPACGLTRAFKSLIQLDIKGALQYNYLSLLILLFLLIMNIYLIYDIITNKKSTNKFLKKIGNHYILIVIILIINTIINNIK